jgi:type I restriction enzyme M protein
LDLPSQRDFIENNESISDLSKLKLDSLDAIDEENFKDFMTILKRENDKIHPKNPVQSLIVEFLTLKVFDEKRSKRNKNFLQFYILPEEKENIKPFRERII